MKKTNLYLKDFTIVSLLLLIIIFSCKKTENLSPIVPIDKGIVSVSLSKFSIVIIGTQDSIGSGASISFSLNLQNDSSAAINAGFSATISNSNLIDSFIMDGLNMPLVNGKFNVSKNITANSKSTSSIRIALKKILVPSQLINNTISAISIDSVSYNSFKKAVSAKGNLFILKLDTLAKISIGGKIFTASSGGALNDTSTQTSRLTNVINGLDAGITMTAATIVIGSKTYTANNLGVLSGISSNTSTVSAKTNGQSCRTYITRNGGYFIYDPSLGDVYGDGPTILPLNAPVGNANINILYPNNVDVSAYFSLTESSLNGYYYSQYVNQKAFTFYGEISDSPFIIKSFKKSCDYLLTQGQAYADRTVTVQRDGNCLTPTKETITVGGIVFTNNVAGYSITAVGTTIGAFTNGSSTNRSANKAQCMYGSIIFISNDPAGALDLQALINSNPKFTIISQGAN